MIKLGEAHVNVSSNPAEKVVAKLRANLANPSVQAAGCSVLEAFAKTAENGVSIILAGGVEAVIAALHAFPENVALQMQGIRTLHGFHVTTVEDTAHNLMVSPAVWGRNDDVEA